MNHEIRKSRFSWQKMLRKGKEVIEMLKRRRPALELKTTCRVLDLAFLDNCFDELSQVSIESTYFNILLTVQDLIG